MLDSSTAPMDFGTDMILLILKEMPEFPKYSI
jgi:hypothetical protein